MPCDVLPFGCDALRQDQDTSAAATRVRLLAFENGNDTGRG
jgi:hypothetical protein